MRGLGTRVILFINLFNALFGHVGVNLRRGNIGMAEHHLHGAQVGAVLEQVRGKGVAQHMRREFKRNPGLPPIPGDHQPNGLTT